jgi:hypothetical protein
MWLHGTGFQLGHAVTVASGTPCRLLICLILAIHFVEAP